MGIGPDDVEVLYGHLLPIDPLTIDWWYDLQPSTWGCDCPAKECHAMMHREDCWVTPMFAQLVNEMGSPRDIATDIYAANMGIVYHLIPCAVCGHHIPAKDADVIFRMGGEVAKAVCPRHNRKGVVGFQGVAPSGY